MNRIICIGNPLVAEDRAGFEVFQRLRTMELPNDVEVIDGGLSGLDLLRFVDGAQRVVFVDNVEGEDTDDGLVVLEPDRVAESWDGAGYHHGAGLPWLLKILPGVAEHALPTIRIVGMAPRSSSATCWKAAALCLQLLHSADAQDGQPASNQRRPA